MSGEQILIVDDDPAILEVLEARLSASGFRVLRAGDGDGALKILDKEIVDLMVSDVKMPGKNGLELFELVHQRHPGLPVIFLTAYGTIPDAVAAVKAGAWDYISKPFDGRMLIEKIRDILAAVASAPSEDLPGGFEDNYYWGTSPAMKELARVVAKVAATRINVLILGESGCGKEGLARYIHSHSSRASRPYVIVDCGSTPSGILESELFGHRKGAFTHAVRDKQGLIQAAHTGTLFLDEVGNVSHDMQCRLLRFLENSTVRQVGAVADTTVDCRIISATNSDLGSQIEAGEFRRDLFYRLKGVKLVLPPLRERREDIPALARFFACGGHREGEQDVVEISETAMDLILSHDWPGNIRELKNTVETAAVLCGNGVIEPGDLQIEELGSREGEAALSAGGEFSIEESEKQTLIRALKKSRGVQKHAADLLGISKRSMHYKVKKYEISPGDFK